MLLRSYPTASSDRITRLFQTDGNTTGGGQELSAALLSHTFPRSTKAPKLGLVALLHKRLAKEQYTPPPTTTRLYSPQTSPHEDRQMWKAASATDGWLPSRDGTSSACSVNISPCVPHECPAACSSSASCLALAVPKLHLLCNPALRSYNCGWWAASEHF